MADKSLDELAQAEKSGKVVIDSLGNLVANQKPGVTPKLILERFMKGMKNADLKKLMSGLAAGEYSLTQTDVDEAGKPVYDLIRNLTDKQIADQKKLMSADMPRMIDEAIRKKILGDIKRAGKAIQQNSAGLVNSVGKVLGEMEGFGELDEGNIMFNAFTELKDIDMKNIDPKNIDPATAEAIANSIVESVFGTGDDDVSKEVEDFYNKIEKQYNERIQEIEKSSIDTLKEQVDKLKTLVGEDTTAPLEQEIEKIGTLETPKERLDLSSEIADKISDIVAENIPEGQSGQSDKVNEQKDKIKSELQIQKVKQEEGIKQAEEMMLEVQKYLSGDDETDLDKINSLIESLNIQESDLANISKVDIENSINNEVNEKISQIQKELTEVEAIDTATIDNIDKIKEQQLKEIEDTMTKEFKKNGRKKLSKSQKEKISKEKDTMSILADEKKKALQNKKQADDLIQQYEEVSEKVEKIQNIKGEIDEVDEIKKQATAEGSGKTRFQGEGAGIIERETLAIKERSKALSEGKQEMTDATRSAGEYTGTVATAGDAMNTMMTQFGTYFLRLRMVQRGFEDIFKAIAQFQSIEDVAFELGIVSQMEIEQIRKYRNELMLLAINYRQTAEDIGKAQIGIMKTGMGLVDAQKTVMAALDLAKATYSDVDSVAGSINKLLLPLERTGDAAYRVAEQMYNISITTPASMHSIEQALQNTSAAFAGLLDDTALAGSELESYKDTITQTELALIGLMHTQGKSGSQAGTGLKMFIDRMRAPTDKTSKVFDEKMAQSSIARDAGVSSMKDFSALIGQDINKALNLISGMFKAGDIGIEEVSTMVGTRNASAIARLLSQIGGDIEGVSKALLEQSDLYQDANKSLKSWSTEIEQMKNSFKALRIVGMDAAAPLKLMVRGITHVTKVLAEGAARSPALSSLATTGGITAMGAKGLAAWTGVNVIGQTMGNKNIIKSFIDSFGKNIKDIDDTIKLKGMYMVDSLKNFGKGVGSAAAADTPGLLAKLSTGIAGLAASPIAWIIALIAAITYLVNKLKKQKEATVELNKMLDDNISKQIESMRAYEDILKQTILGINSIGFSASATTKQLEFMTDAMQELQRETKFAVTELKGFDIGGFTEKYIEGVKKQLEKDDKVNEYNKKSRIEDLEKLFKMYNKGTNISDSDKVSDMNIMQYMLSKYEKGLSHDTHWFKRILNTVKLTGEAAATIGTSGLYVPAKYKNERDRVVSQRKESSSNLKSMSAFELEGISEMFNNESLKAQFLDNGKLKILSDKDFKVLTNEQKGFYNILSIMMNDMQIDIETISAFFNGVTEMKKELSQVAESNQKIMADRISLFTKKFGIVESAYRQESSNVRVMQSYEKSISAAYAISKLNNTSMLEVYDGLNEKYTNLTYVLKNEGKLIEVIANTTKMKKAEADVNKRYKELLSKYEVTLLDYGFLEDKAKVLEEILENLEKAEKDFKKAINKNDKKSAQEEINKYNKEIEKELNLGSENITETIIRKMIETTSEEVQKALSILVLQKFTSGDITEDQYKEILLASETINEKYFSITKKASIELNNAILNGMLTNMTGLQSEVERISAQSQVYDDTGLRDSMMLFDYKQELVRKELEEMTKVQYEIMLNQGDIGSKQLRENILKKKEELLEEKQNLKNSLEKATDFEKSVINMKIYKIDKQLDNLLDPSNYQGTETQNEISKLLATIENGRNEVMDILFGSNLKEMISMTYNDFIDRLGEIYKDKIPMSDENILKLYKLFMDEKINLYKSLKITPAEIKEFENNYKKFTADLSKTKFETAGIGLDGDASKLYNIQKRFNAEIANRINTDIDNAKRAYKKALDALTDEQKVDVKGYDNPKIGISDIKEQLSKMFDENGDLIKGNNEKYAAALKELLNIKQLEINEEQLKLKAQREIANELIQYKNELAQQVRDLRKDMGIVTPTTVEEKDYAVANLQSYRKSLDKTLNSLIASLGNDTNVDIQKLLSGDEEYIAKLAKSSNGNYKELLDNITLYNKAIKDNKQIIEDHYDYIASQYNGLITSESQQQQLSIQNAQKAYELTPNATNREKYLKESFDYMLSSANKGLKQASELTNVFGNIPALQLASAKMQQGMLQNEIQLLKEKSYLFADQEDLSHRIALLQLQNQKISLDQQVQELNALKEQRALEKQLKELRSKSQFSEEGKKPLSQKIKEGTQNVLTDTQKEIEMIELERQTQIAAIDATLIAIRSTDSNTIATNELTKAILTPIKDAYFNREASNMIDNITDKEGINKAVIADAFNANNIGFLQTMNQGTAGHEAYKGKLDDILKLAIKKNEINFEDWFKEQQGNKTKMTNDNDDQINRINLLLEDQKTIINSNKELEKQVALAKQLGELERVRTEAIQEHMNTYGDVYDRVDSLLKGDFLQNYGQGKGSVKGLATTGMDLFAGIEQRKKLEKSIKEEEKKDAEKEKELKKKFLSSSSPKEKFDALKDLGALLALRKKRREVTKEEKDKQTLQGIALVFEAIQFTSNLLMSAEQTRMQNAISKYKMEIETLELQKQLYKSVVAQYRIQRLIQNREKEMFDLQQSAQKQQLNQQVMNAGLSSAQSGAMAGFTMSGGNPVGAVVGGVIGAIGGLFGGGKARSAERKRMEEERISFNNKRLIDTLVELQQTFQQYNDMVLDMIRNTLRDLAEQAAAKGSATDANKFLSKIDAEKESIASEFLNKSFAVGTRELKQVNVDVGKLLEKTPEDLTSGEYDVSKTKLTRQDIIDSMDLSEYDRIEERDGKYYGIKETKTTWANQYGPQENVNVKETELFDNEQLDITLKEFEESALETSIALRELGAASKTLANMLFYSNKRGFEISKREDDTSKIMEDYNTKMRYAESLRNAGREDEADAEVAKAEATRTADLEEVANKYGEFNEVFSSTFSKENFAKILENAEPGKNIKDSIVGILANTFGNIGYNLNETFINAIWGSANVKGVNLSDAIDQVNQTTMEYLKTLTPEEQKQWAEKGVAGYNDLSIEANTAQETKLHRENYGLMEENKRFKESIKNMATSMEGKSELERFKIAAGILEIQEKIKDNEEKIKSNQETIDTTLTFNDVIKATVDTIQSIPYKDIRKESESFIQMLMDDYGLPESKAREVAASMGLVDVYEDVISAMKELGDVLRKSKAKLSKSSQDFWSQEATLITNPSTGSTTLSKEMEKPAQTYINKLTQELKDTIVSSSFKEEKAETEEEKRKYQEQRLVAEIQLASLSDHDKSIGIEMSKAEDYENLLSKEYKGELTEDELLRLNEYKRMEKYFQIQEAVYGAMQNGISSALNADNYKDQFNALASVISETFQFSMIESLDIDLDATAQSIAELLSQGDISGAVEQTNTLTNTIVEQRLQIEKLRKEAIDSGMLISQANSVFGAGKYMPIEDVLKTTAVMRGYLSDVKRAEIDFTKEVVAHNNSLMTRNDLYDELIAKQAEGLALTEDETRYITQFEEMLQYLKLKETLATELEGAVSTAFTSDYTASFASFSDTITNTLKTKLTEGLTESLRPQLEDLTSLTADAVTTSSISSLFAAQQAAQALTASTTASYNQMSGLFSLFSTDFSSSPTDISYSSPTSKSTTYNITQSISLNAGALIGDNVSMERLAKALTPILKKELSKI